MLSAVSHPTGQWDLGGAESDVQRAFACMPIPSELPDEAGLFHAGINRVGSSLCVPRLDAGPLIRSCMSEF